MAISKLSDLELVACFQETIMDERERLVLQLEYLAELDRRKLFFHYSSLRSYLVEEHGIEEWNAERKIRAARLVVKFSILKGKLESGQLNLTLMELVQGCAFREKLSDVEVTELFEAVSGMSCRGAMREIATRYPQSMEMPRDRIRPLTADLSEVRFVANQELLDKLDEIRGLLAHSHPRIEMGELIDVLATEFRTRHHPEEKARRAEERRRAKEGEERRAGKGRDEREGVQGEVQEMRLANQSGEGEQGRRESPTDEVDSPTAPRVLANLAYPSNPRTENRSPSQAIVHGLTLKDGYHCAYVDPVTQIRCESKYGLEKDHIQTWWSGGKTELSNFRYLCANHHRRVSFLQFGEAAKYARKK